MDDFSTFHRTGFQVEGQSGHLSFELQFSRLMSVSVVKLSAPYLKRRRNFLAAQVSPGAPPEYPFVTYISDVCTLLGIVSK